MRSSDFDWKRVRGQQVMQVLLQLMLVMIWHLATLGKVMPFARNFVKGGASRDASLVLVLTRCAPLKAVLQLQLGYVD